MIQDVISSKYFSANAAPQLFRLCCLLRRQQTGDSSAVLWQWGQFSTSS